MSLRQNVATTWADNLLFAQEPQNCSYCASEPDSLQLSINAVLKAIGLEQSLDGLTFCNQSDCTIANTQSTIAINDQVRITLTPSFINFGDVPVDPTPEPLTWAMCGLGALAITAARLLTGRGATRR